MRTYPSGYLVEQDTNTSRSNGREEGQISYIVENAVRVPFKTNLASTPPRYHGLRGLFRLPKVHPLPVQDDFELSNVNLKRILGLPVWL